MSTLIAPRPLTDIPARIWFDQHLPELRSRAELFAHRFRRGQRQDAVAEMLAQIWKYVRRAQDRGKVEMLTPYTLVGFFGRSYAAGRRLCGTCTTDVMSRAAQIRHSVRVVSLDEPRWVRTPDGMALLPLSEILADGRAPDPLENCRQDVDYPEILKRQKASRQARRVFAWLAASHGTATGIDMARRLRVSPPRIVQLKHQLARHLAAEGYAPPWSRAGRLEQRRRGRPRRHAPPLNAGTSPPSSYMQRCSARRMPILAGEEE